jgi:hypothetical protein
MFENTILDRTKRAFAEQFEKETSGYLFRENQQGAAIPVSDVERDAFVKRYGIAATILSFLFVAGFLGIVFAIGTYTDQMESPPSDETIIAGVIGITVVLAMVYIIAVLRIWRTPVRVLARRSAVRMERSSDAAAAAMISKIGWTQLGFGAIAIAFAVLKFSRNYDLTQGMGLILTSLAGLAALVLAYQAYRKWKLGNRTG